MITGLTPSAAPATLPAFGAHSSAEQTNSNSSASSTSNPSVDGLGDEETFMQLLVAQLKNQDPTSPQDETQFVTQLAEFSSLQQEVEMRTDLDSISQALTPASNQTGAAQKSNS